MREGDGATMPVLIQIAVGGAIGAALRYLSVVLVTRFAGTWFPWGTMAVNVLGSFVMGVCAVMLLLRDGPGSQAAAPFLMTGVLGGFTTFSAFSLETFELLEEERFLSALAYTAGSVVLAVAALAAGMWFARGLAAP